MDQVHRQIKVILYLAENAQEFIFVHIPKTNMGDNPLRQKNWPYHFFLGTTPISCIHLYILHTLVYLAYTCISCIHLYILYTLVYLVYICISCIHLYILYTLVYLVFTCYRFLNGFYLYLKHNYILKNTYHYCITYLVIYI